MKSKSYTLFLVILSFFCVLFNTNASSISIVDGGEYYLYNIFYDCVLSSKADGVTPGMSKAGTNTDADSYIFVAEASGSDGYFLLRQKSSNKYLAASTSNVWSVVFQSVRATTDAYLWSLIAGLDGSVSCKRNSSAYLGADAGKEGDTYISVFYDKTPSDFSRWEIFDANSGFDYSRKQLYLEELLRSITSGQFMVEQTTYSESWRQQVDTAVVTAKVVYDNAASYTLDQIVGATDALRQVLIDCRASDVLTLLSGVDFDVDNAFTIALNGLTQVSDSTSITVLVRNANGVGAVIEIGADNRVSVEDKVLVEDSTFSANHVNNYQFAFTGSIVQVYRDGILLGAAPSYVVPAYTANGMNAEWAILSASALDKFVPEVISATKAVAQGTAVVDQYGNNTRYAVFLNDVTLNLSEAVDFHIMDEDNPMTNSTINLIHKNAWVIFDNTLPSVVVNSYLSFLKVNGQQAVVGSNVRVAIYLNGAIVMAESSNMTPFTGYSGEQYAGEATSLDLGANELGENCNVFQSFTLQRGYMAVLASGSKGSGYSRVYVADHQDVEVPILPNALYQRISSVHVKKWNYVNKKGWCSTTSNAAIATECKKVRATWFYTWSADRNSTYDTEYIPILQHLYWPSMSQISGQTNSTHVLSINEPEHAEQHSPDKCSCGGVISTWKACTITPDFQETGMRIGSPAPTDASWLTEYIGHCDDMAYRCDFVVMHCYWGTNEAYNATSWYNRLKAIYDNTKRPIWITEWNNGASWTTESWPSGYGDKLEKNRVAIKEIIHMLDTCSFIERYSIYNWDSYYRAMIADDGWVTPAGQVYRNNKSTFAYNAKMQFIPLWWAPALKEVNLKVKINALSEQLEFTINNDNGDMTDQLIIQRKNAEGNFEDYFTETDRSVFDKTSISYAFDLADFDINSDEFRLQVTIVSGEEVFSPTVGLGYIVNPNIVTSSQTAVDGWFCSKSASNGFTKGVGDTYFEVWDPISDDMNFDYYQDIDNLVDGVYELSASCFNSSNGVADAVVNGHVGLYAQADGIEYFSSVTEDGELDLSVRQTIPSVVVKNGTLRIGFKNLGAMTARWAGADEFKLKYVGTYDEVLSQGYEVFKEEMREQSDERYKALFVWNEDTTLADASSVLVNPDCARKDIYGWGTNAVDYAIGEAYDDDSENSYWNKWSSSAYTSEMFQDLVFLPAGEYTARVMLRCSADTEMDFYVSLDGGKTKEALKIFTGSGNDSSAGSEFTNGWQQVTAPTVILQKGDSLRIGFSITATNKWWSADHFTLNYSLPSASGLDELGFFIPQDDVQIVRGNGGLLVSTSSPTMITIYAMSGLVVAQQKVGIGSTFIRIPRGIYVVNRQLIIL